MKRRIICILIILFLFIFIFFTACSKKDEFISISNNDILVDKALSYFKYSVGDKKELMEKIFDKNDSIIIEDDLNNGEKMYMVLEEYDRLNDGCIFSQVGRLCSFKKKDINNLVFTNTNFINDYVDSRKYYNINGIDLMYNEDIFQAQGHIVEEAENRIVYFDVVNAKKNNKELVIEFVMSYLEFDYSSENLDIEKVYYFKNINDNDYVYEKDRNTKEDNFDKLDNTKFNKYRYTLKIDKDNLYFKSIEKI